MTTKQIAEDTLEAPELTPDQTAAALAVPEASATPAAADDQTDSLELAHSHEHDHSHEHEPAQPTMNPELMREIAVEVDADTVSKSFKTVVKKYQKLARIPGFRVGKVPETVIKTRFGKEVRQEVMEQLVTERFQQMLASEGFNPISEPQLTELNLVDGQPLRFRARFEIAPTVDITGYDEVSVIKPETDLTEAEFEAEMARVMDAHGTVETIEEDRELRDGDWAEIEFTGVIQGLAEAAGTDGAEAMEGSPEEPIRGEDVLLEVAGKNTLPAFTDALRGTKPGQEMSFEVTYPADFGEPRLAGQTVKYELKVKAIKSKTFPEKDDELAKQIGDYETWADFESQLREHAAGRKKQTLENAAKDRMLTELINRLQFPVPETFVQQQIDARLDRGLRALAEQGMTAEDMRKLNFAQLRAAQRDQAVAEVKASLILDKVAESEAVEVADDELERELLMASLRAREPLETIRQRMIQDGSFERMRDQMRREKAGTVLYERLLTA